MSRYQKKLRIRHFYNQAFKILLFIVIALSLIVLITLLFDIFKKGFQTLTWDFLTSMPSGRATRAGILPSLVGSLVLIALTALISIPLGVGTAIYLELYANKRSRFFKLLQLNIANLAGVPSIVYGILGLAIFSQLLKLGLV